MEIIFRLKEKQKSESLFCFVNDIPVYPEVSVILSNAKNPALGLGKRHLVTMPFSSAALAEKIVTEFYISLVGTNFARFFTAFRMTK